MAVNCINFSANMRFADKDAKTIATYLSIDPDVSAESVNLFAAGISALSSRPVAEKHVTVSSLLEESAESPEA